MATVKQYANKTTGKKLWKLRLYAGTDEVTGKRKYINRQGFKTRKEAMQALHELEFKKDLGKLTANNKRIKFSDAAAMWLKVHKLSVRESTYRNTLIQFNKHILPALGDCYCDKISLHLLQSAVERWKNSIPSQLTLAINRVNSALEYARKNGYKTVNYTKDVTFPKKKKAVKYDNYYTKKQLEHFLQVVYDSGNLKYYTLFRLLAFGGLRIGEALVLNWDDLDDHNTLHITKTLAKGVNGQTIINPPKTAAGMREVLLDKRTVAILRQYQTRQTRILFKLGRTQQAKGRMFLNCDFEPFKSEASISSFLNTIYKRHTELKQIKPHGFRHTHTTLLSEAGVSLQNIAERLGHDDVDTTLKVYTHITDSARQETVAKFSRLMQG